MSVCHIHSCPAFPAAGDYESGGRQEEGLWNLHRALSVLPPAALLGKRKVASAHESGFPRKK